MSGKCGPTGNSIARGQSQPGYPAMTKIPRLNKRVVITEKVDGTNGLISIEDVTEAKEWEGAPPMYPYSMQGLTWMPLDGRLFEIQAGSRNRWLTPEADNFGFAAWVRENAEELVKLGPGKHYGEWFGRGIQRGYGLDEKRFALFNAARWIAAEEENQEEYREFFPKAQLAPECVTVVPVMAVCDGSDMNAHVQVCMTILERNGSLIAPGFDNPEGVIVYHEAAGQLFKVIRGQHADAPKGAAA